MKKYKVLYESEPKIIQKKLNNYSKKGWKLQDWKIASQGVAIFLEREVEVDE